MVESQESERGNYEPRPNKTEQMCVQIFAGNPGNRLCLAESFMGPHCLNYPGCLIGNYGDSRLLLLLLRT
jgi:hypothetical protein